MPRHALERVRLGQPMPGVIAVHQRVSITSIIDELVLVATCGTATDWADSVQHLPLRSS